MKSCFSTGLALVTSVSVLLQTCFRAVLVLVYSCFSAGLVFFQDRFSSGLLLLHGGLVLEKSCFWFCPEFVSISIRTT